MIALLKLKRIRESLSYLQFISNTNTGELRLALKCLLIFIFFFSVFKISKGVLMWLILSLAEVSTFLHIKITCSFNFAS